GVLPVDDRPRFVAGRRARVIVIHGGAAPAMTSPSSTTGELRLAIVDDEEFVRVALRRFCSSLGMRVSTYSSGRALIDGLDGSACIPDCLLLDAHMPDMTGLEILQQLARRAVRFPTIVYSGDDEPEA